MKSPLYPCLWFDGNSAEAAGFYTSLFADGKILSANPMATTFELAGCEFMALNGGPMYKITPAISFTVYGNSENEVQQLYNALSVGGTVMIPLGRYDWSPMYAWVEDKFGVSWQLDANSAGQHQKIVPTLLFVNEKNAKVKEALEFYCGIFPGSVKHFEAQHAPESGMPDGALIFAQFGLKGKVLNAMSSTMPHDYDFTPGNSLVVECETQYEIDYYWERLGHAGKYSMCGWLEDKFGVSWQIIPAVLPEIMKDTERAQRVTAAFLTMQKLDMEVLLNA